MISFAKAAAAVVAGILVYRLIVAGVDAAGLDKGFIGKVLS